MLPTDSPITWWEWAGRFVTVKWGTLAPTSRRSVAEVLGTVTPVMVEDTGRQLPEKALRAAMFGWAFNALRPSEALALRVDDLDLPAGSEPSDTRGQLILSRSDVEIAGRWIDDGRRARQLKHRARGTVRPVPCPPDLVTLLRAHRKDPGPAPDGRLFYGPYGGTISWATYNGVWARARQRVLTPVEQASSLAGRPYDLRHTAASGWLASGVDSALVAAWAGHSVAVLHRVNAHVVRGREAEAKRRIQDYLGP
jgi:integrase